MSVESMLKKMRELSGKATKGDLRLYLISPNGKGGTSLLQAGRPNDSYGKENFSATSEDAELLSYLRNNIDTLCEVVERQKKVLESVACIVAVVSGPMPTKEDLDCAWNEIDITLTETDQLCGGVE